MRIKEITQYLDQIAPPAYQESYDNAGLLTGDPNWECQSILTTLDCTEIIVDEAIAKGCNLIVAHHPIIFKGLKKINGKNYVEKTIIKAIKNDIAIFAIHTNLDSVQNGVNKKIADIIGIQSNTLQMMSPQANKLCKLVIYFPNEKEKISTVDNKPEAVFSIEEFREYLFAAGAGKIGDYHKASFNQTGIGTFQNPENHESAIGEKGSFESVAETKIEVLVSLQDQSRILAAAKRRHPYHEMAYDIIPLLNENQEVGIGMVGELEKAMPATAFLQLLQERFKVPVVKHTALIHEQVKRIAICGGSGSFLTKTAIAAKADIYVTADIKYHEFFDADGKVILADIGHFESEQFTADLLADFLREKFPNFAVLKSDLCTNPVSYFI